MAHAGHAVRLALAVLLMIGGTAAAHPLDTAYLRVEAKDRALAITFDLDVALAAQELKLEAGAVEQALASRGGELAAKLYRSAAPRVGDTACTWGESRARRKGTTVTIVDTASCPAGDVRWDLSFGKRLATTFQILGKVIDGTGEHVITIDKTTTELAIAAAAGTSFERSIWIGIEHVGLVPSGWHGLPAGLECLALALLLLLAGGGLQGQLSRAGMLVVGHGVGMLLPAPPMVGNVMLMIAIAAIAGSLAAGKLTRHRWLLAAIAGVAHGIATGSTSTHAIGFVLGFAIAQIAIAIVLGPLVGMVEKRIDRAVPIAAIVLGAISIYGVVRWF